MSSNNDNFKSSGDMLTLPTKGTTIKHGDLCVYDAATHNILPATGASEDVLLVGVAQSASLSPQGFDTDNAAVTVQVTPISVATRGVFEFTIGSGQYYIGDLVKIAGAQTVAKCSTNETCIGVVVENTAASATKVKVKIGGAMTNQNLFLG